MIKTVETSGTGLPWGVQQSRLSASNMRGLSSIPGRELGSHVLHVPAENILKKSLRPLL